MPAAVRRFVERGRRGLGETRREPFEERYRRVTIYLEKSLHARVQELRRSSRVGSVTALYNAALRQYINRYYYD